MAIPKEQKVPLENKTPDHSEKVKRVIKAITTKHPKLLKKLAE